MSMADTPKSSPSVAERLRRWIAPQGVCLEHEDYDLFIEAAGELDRLTALVEEAGEIIETGFRKPFDHLDGCLFKANRRMPCQCNLQGRLRDFRNGALAYLSKLQGEKADG